MADPASAPAAGLPEVTILMGLHNGARHLPAQLASIARQKGVRWRLVMADDASQDDTRVIAAACARRFGPRARLIEGPARGHVANYLTLLSGLDAAPGPVALADQDDVWFPDKLARALAALADATDRPALYCTAARIDARRATRRFRRAPAFRNALVQNIAAGHSIVLNTAAARLARDAARDLAHDDLLTAPAAHDWFLYQLVTGAGGRVIYDPRPSLLYRQHGGNLIGANRGIAARARRLWAGLRGQFRDWGQGNRAALAAVAGRLTKPARDELAHFAALADPRPVARLRALVRLRPYRQSALGSAALWLAAILRRV